MTSMLFLVSRHKMMWANEQTVSIRVLCLNVRIIIGPLKRRRVSLSGLSVVSINASFWLNNAHSISAQEYCKLSIKAIVCRMMCAYFSIIISLSLSLSRLFYRFICHTFCVCVSKCNNEKLRAIWDVKVAKYIAHCSIFPFFVVLFTLLSLSQHYLLPLHEKPLYYTKIDGVFFSSPSFSLFFALVLFRFVLCYAIFHHWNWMETWNVVCVAVTDNCMLLFG